MGISQLSEYHESERYVFHPGNEISFGMDFRWFCGVPSELVFFKKGEIGSSLIELVAIGYGVAGNYGNGSIVIKRDDLSKGTKL